MAWRDKARKVAAGKWIKFDAQNLMWEIYFKEDPTEVKKTVVQGDRKGEEYSEMSFPVVVDGEDRILEPNKSLLRQLLDED